MIGLGILTVLCIAYIWFFGLQTFYVWEIRKLARTNPLMWTTPVALTDQSISQAPDQKFSYFGYDFEVPWDDVDPVKTRVVADDKAIVVFRSGNAVSFWTADAYGLLSMVALQGKMDQNDLQQMFGKEAARSNLDFARAVLDMTPGRFSPFIPKMQAIQQGSLFMMKVAIMRSSASSGIFSVATKEFNGFQYGRPH